MPDNPYRSSHAAPPPVKKTRPTSWLIWSGVAAIVAAAVCCVITFVVVILAFTVIEDPNAPTQTELARIGFAMFPSMAAVPLGILGLALVVTGFLVRQPEE